MTVTELMRARRKEPETPEAIEPGIGNLDRDFDAPLDRRALRQLCGLPQTITYEAAA